MALRPTPAIVDADGQAKVSDLLDVGVVNQVYCPNQESVACRLRDEQAICRAV
jgi:hypothetical protein